MGDLEIDADLLQKRDSGTEPVPEIRRARLQRLTIYEVEEYQLDILEHGGPDSIVFNIAICLISIAASLTATLFTAEFRSERLWILFLVVTIICGLVGIILLLIWSKSRRSVASCVKNIRQRLPPDSMDETEN